MRRSPEPPIQPRTLCLPQLPSGRRQAGHLHSAGARYAYRPIRASGKPNFWQSLFYSKYHEEPSFQTQKRVKAVEGETYEQRVYSRFDYFSLTLEQLKVNLYPLDTKIYHDYKQFSPLKRDGVDVYAVDCEMVRTEQGLELARVSIVDYEYRVVMDEFVKPANAVLDHNTQ